MVPDTSFRTRACRHIAGAMTALSIAALLAGACGKKSPTSPGGCQIVTGITTTTFPPAGGTASITVDTSPSCTWTATSNQGFLTVTSGSSGSGQGTVVFAVAANPGAQRVATLKITGTDILITQLSATP